jgi:hypothetical protein
MMELIVGAIVVAFIFVLVRPGSKGPTLVKGLGEAFSGIITTAIG